MSTGPDADTGERAAIIVAKSGPVLPKGEMRARVAACVKEGMTAEQISSHLEIGATSVAYHLRRAGLKAVDKRQVRKREKSEATEAYSGVVLNNNMLQVGRAGEYLVCADLLIRGYETFPTDQGLPYDLIVVDARGKLFRVQVKTAQRPRNANATGRVPNLVYSYNVRSRGKGGQRRISSADCDAIACVGMADRVVAYFSCREAIGQTVQLQPPGFKFTGRSPKGRRFKTIDEYPPERVFGALR